MNVGFKIMGRTLLDYGEELEESGAVLILGHL
jgi:hypothetical protein